MTVESVAAMPNAGTVWRFPFAFILLTVLISAATLLPFWDGLTYMWESWLALPEYSHSLMIPPIAAFLVWQQKDRLELVSFGGSWWGVALVLIGSAILVLGQLGTVYVLVQYAFLITLCGLAWALTGNKAFRLIAMPLFILFFMVPLPYFVLHNLSSKLQLISSEIGVAFMRMFGISVFVEGNVIDLGGYKLQVAEACDGLRYLFPLMTLGFLMAYFYKGALWKRVLLFLSSIPLTVVMNSFRVGTIGIMVEHWGISMAEGFLHEFQGWMVFMASAALMLCEIVLLNRIGHESGTWRQVFGVEFPAPSPSGAMRVSRAVPLPFVVAAACLALTAAAALLLPRSAEIFPQRTSFTAFPRKIGSWVGHPDIMDGVFLEALKLEDYELSDYVNSDSVGVNLYIAYYSSQRKGEAVHSPRSCLPGGGWQFSGFEQRTLNATINGQPLRVNRTVIELGDKRQLVYYWFQQRGRVITNELTVKWYLFWDALTRHRTDGALVRVIVPLKPAGDDALAERQLAEFTALVAAQLPRFVPN